MKQVMLCVVVFFQQGCTTLECRVHYSADECETLLVSPAGAYSNQEWSE